MKEKLPDNHKVILVSDHPLVIGCVRGSLKFGHTTVVSTCKADFFVHSGAQCSVLIIDGMSIGPRLQLLLRSIRRAQADVRILVLHSSLSEVEVHELLRCGIDGYVTVAHLRRDLKKAINALLLGRLWLHPDLLVSYVKNLRSRFSIPDDSLFTEREARITELLERRLSNKEIGSFLNISQNTVKFHLGRIYRKLGVNDRYTAVEVLLKSQSNVSAVHDLNPSLLHFGRKQSV